MFEKFGEFNSAEELNMAAEGFLGEQDIDSLMKLAEENGIEKEDAEDYADGLSKELVGETMAALGRLKVFREDAGREKDTGMRFAMQTILKFTETLVVAEPEMASAVMLKGKRISEIAGAMRQSARDNGGVSCGTDRQLEGIIRAYYLEGKKAMKKIIAELGKGEQG